LTEVLPAQTSTYRSGHLFRISCGSARRTSSISLVLIFEESNSKTAMTACDGCGKHGIHSISVSPDSFLAVKQIVAQAEAERDAADGSRAQQSNESAA
jgi:hypothetical protein